MINNKKFELMIGSFQVIAWKNEASEKERLLANTLNEVNTFITKVGQLRLQT